MALLSTAVFIPGLVVLIIKKTCSFNDGPFFIWPMRVALPESTRIAVMLVGFHFLRKVVGSVAENNGRYIMDNDAIFILSSVGVVVRKCIVLVFFYNGSPFHNKCYILFSCYGGDLLPDDFNYFPQNDHHQKS